jgi:hypothetical protein
MNSLKRTSVVSTATVDDGPLDVTKAPWANKESKVPKAQNAAPMIRNLLNNLNPEKD